MLLFAETFQKTRLVHDSDSFQGRWKSPRPSSIRYGRGLTVCGTTVTLRSLKFLECLEAARMERLFVGLVRSSPEGKKSMVT